MNAIYVHGLGSGAATSGLSTIAKILYQYKWHAVEVNESLPESVSIINAAVKELDPCLLMGTSLGGLYVMYATCLTTLAVEGFFVIQPVTYQRLLDRP